jgi:acylphosphatase
VSSSVRRRVVVSGRVQGVWFRDSCRRQAELEGLAGWVRNLPDGRVEAVFEGEAPAVDSLVHWCREGPRLAQVSDVQQFDEDPQGETGFVIR